MISVIFNVNLWIRYYIKIGFMAASIGFIEYDKTQQKKIKNFLRVVDVSTFLMNAIIVSFAIVYTMMDGKLYSTDKFSGEIFIGTTFGILGVLSLMAGLATVLRIRFYFPEFYDENKKILYAAILGISLPLFVHCIIDLMRLDETYQDFLSTHTTLMNTIIFVFGDIIPIIF
jgi:hypothetical protein